MGRTLRLTLWPDLTPEIQHDSERGRLTGVLGFGPGPLLLFGGVGMARTSNRNVAPPFGPADDSHTKPPKIASYRVRSLTNGLGAEPVDRVAELEAVIAALKAQRPARTRPVA